MAVTWLWAGAVSASGFTVTAKVGAGVSVRLGVQAGDLSSLTSPTYGTAVNSDTDGYVKVAITGLAANTAYTYGLELAGSLDPMVGHVTTFPTAGTATSFRLAHGTCMDTGTNHRVFDSIVAKDPLVFIEAGDLHYADYNGTVAATRLGHYDGIMAQARPAALFRSMPVDYVWDDHDFCGNNSIGTATGKATAQTVYRQAIPHYSLPDSAAVYHSFQVGRVGVIVTDLRSYRAANGDADGPGKSMMGATQKQWWKDTLLALDAAGATLILWVSSSVYNGLGTTGVWYDNDQWSAFATERAELADFIKANGLGSRVFMLTGDAHMLAYDDGSNSDFATGGGAPLRQFCGAALDRPAIIRGDNWSGGTFGGPGQYGWFDFTDNGTDIAWTWHGVKVDPTSGADTTLITASGSVGPTPPPPEVGPYHDETLVRAGSSIAVTGDTIPLKIDLSECSPEWWQHVSVTHTEQLVALSAGTTAGSNSGTSSNYPGATQDVIVSGSGFRLDSLTFQARFADTYTLKIDAVTAGTVTAAAAGDVTFTGLNRDLAPGTYEFSITANTVTTSRTWRYETGNNKTLAYGDLYSITLVDWKEAATYYLPWVFNLTADAGYDTASFEVQAGGVAQPYDLAFIDRDNRRGTAFVKTALTAGVDKVLTLHADPLLAGTAPARRGAGSTVWAGFDAVVAGPSPINRVDGTALGVVGSAGSLDGETFNLPGSGDGYLYANGLTRRTAYTLGGSVRLDSTTGDQHYVGYGPLGTSNTVVQTMVSHSGAFAMWNSTDVFVGTAPLAAGTRVRGNLTNDPTGGVRTLYLDGASSAADSAIAARPGGTGAVALYVGAGVQGSANTVDGIEDYAYVRDGLLASGWISVETASWEHADTFWTVVPAGSVDLDLPAFGVTADGTCTEPPLVDNLDLTFPPFDVAVYAEADAAAELATMFPALDVQIDGELAGVAAGALGVSFAAFRASFAGSTSGVVRTDTRHDLNGRVRDGIGYVSTDVAVAVPPAGATQGKRVDKAVAYPTPTLVDGRPT